MSARSGGGAASAPDKTARTQRIDLHDEAGLAKWAGRFGVTVPEILTACYLVGCSAAAVERYLKDPEGHLRRMRDRHQLQGSRRSR